MAVTKYAYLDLFAGAGGWSVGFEQAGYAHAAMYDYNESACRTARSNFGDIVHCVDLLHHRDFEMPEVDVVCGSPPCQGFSNEGYKRKDDPRNSLVWTYLDIVRRIRPRVWIFENVPGFKRSYNGHYYDLLVNELKDWNYQFSDFLVDAADYGVPQHRLRFILIAALDFKPRLPPSTHSAANDLLARSRHVNLWDAICDLPPPRLGDRDGRYDYLCDASTDFQKWARAESQMIFNHTAQKHSERVLEKIRAVPIGGDMTAIVKSFDENRVHYCGGYRRATKDQPSYTAYWTRGMTSIHPEQHRFLTPRECARIQSFPDRFVFNGSTIENYTQVCNAIPPLLAKAIGVSVMEQMQSATGRQTVPLTQRADANLNWVRSGSGLS